MELYLMQHGEARPESEDPERPLSARGRHDVEAVARLAARLGVRIETILHSGKLRARQTAEVMAERLQPSPRLAELEGLAPNDDPQRVADGLESQGRSCLLVGHLPQLGRLASLLLVGDASRSLIAFRMGGLVSLVHDDTGWHVRWILTREIVPE
jgi:phosphohistidine phosphatase